MKKTVALLLGLSIAASCAACTHKSEQSTRTTWSAPDKVTSDTEDPTETTEPTEPETSETSDTSETTETSETEETTTEATTTESETSETSESSETSETSETTESETTKETTAKATATPTPSPEPTATPKPTDTPTPTPTPAPTATPAPKMFSKTLSYLNASGPLFAGTGYSFWNTHTGYDYDSSSVVCKRSETFVFYDSDYPELQTAVKNAIAKHSDKAEADYKIAMKKIADAEQNGSAFDGEYIDVRLKRYRFDSQLCSFAITESPNLADGFIETHSFMTSNGAKIAFNNVVKDKAAFTSYVESALKEMDLEKLIDQAKKEISNGTIPFTLTYDGIFVFFPTSDSWYCPQLKVSAVANPTFFNMNFFGQTPEYFTLIADHNGKIVWDFDGDGKEDILTVRAETDDYDWGFGFDIDMNTVIIYNSNKDLPDAYGDCEGIYFVQADDGQYIYLDVGEEDAWESVYCVRLDNYKAKYLGVVNEKYGGFFDEDTFCNPEAVTISYLESLVGTNVLYQDITLLGTNGLWKPTSEFCSSYVTALETKISIRCNRYDASTGSRGSEIDLPVDTSLALVSYDTKKSTVVFKVLTTDVNADPEYVIFDYKGTYPPYLNGVDGNDLFHRLMYGG